MASYVVKQPASAVSFVVLEILLGSNWQEHPGLVAPKPSQNKGSCMRGDKVGSYWVRVSIWLHCTWFFFFPRLGLSELFYWAASRHWDCFYTGQSPDVQSPKAKSTGQSGGVGGEATGVCGVRGELCKEVTEGGGFAFEIVMGGWVFENEGGGKCC